VSEDRRQDETIGIMIPITRHLRERAKDIDASHEHACSSHDMSLSCKIDRLASLGVADDSGLLGGGQRICIELVAIEV